MSEDNAEEPREIAADAEAPPDSVEVGTSSVEEGTSSTAHIAILAAKVRRFRIPIAAASIGVAVIAFAAMFSDGGDRREVTLELGGPLAYYELPEFLADLTPTKQRRHHIQLLIVAQALEPDVGKLDERQLEITAAIQSHLRDQTPESLTGQAGAEQLRADLISIINNIIAPTEIRNVLFTRILIN